MKLLIFLLSLLGITVFSLYNNFYVEEEVVVDYQHKKEEALFYPYNPITKQQTIEINEQIKIASSTPKPEVHIPKSGLHIGSTGDLNEFVGRTSVMPDILAVHIHWGNENMIPEDIVDFAEEYGKTIFVFWNPMDYNKPRDNQREFHFENILSGKWDPYIKKFKAEIAGRKVNFVLAPFEEVNGYWVPWSVSKANYGNLNQYISSFRYLKDKFNDLDNVKFAWVMNHVSVPTIDENDIDVYYPGDQSVDVIGINGFNFDQPWTTFDQIFESVINKIQKYKKPIYISSFATAEGEKKEEWIKDFFNSEIMRDNEIEGWIWFNINKEKDWRIWSDQSSEQIFIKNLSINQ